MAASIFFLEEFGVTLRSLARLGSRKVEVDAYFTHPRSLKSLLALSPEERVERLAASNRRKLRRARARWPSDNLEIFGTARYPLGIRGKVSAKDVPPASEIQGIDYLLVRSIQGRRRRKPRPVHEWYAVRARIAVQVEGHKRGLQTIEERIVLVKAFSPKDADERLRREWEAYAEPYLNSDGELVRWRMEEITDVYELGETEIDPKGTEVYSVLTQRRMRPQYEWHPTTKTKSRGRKRSRRT